MLSSLKNSLKDQIQFSLILFTGLFAGSIFTLIYIKLWEKGDITFGDIGGMLAGVGTISLLAVALNTNDTWKEQLKMQHRKDAVDKYFEKYHHIITLMTKIIVERTLKNDEGGKEPKYEDNFKDNLMKLDASRREFQFALISLETLLKKQLEHGTTIMYLTEILKSPRTFNPDHCNDTAIIIVEHATPLIKELNEFIEGSNI